MTNFNLATGADAPINRTGIENTQFADADAQGIPVGIDNSGADPQLVKADADSGTAIQAVGVYFHLEVIDPATIPTGSYLQDIEEQLVQENKKLMGERGTVVFNGVELVNDDDDTTWTPGEPVYLDTGGGFTQTEPSTTGDIQQVMGVALTPDEGGDGKDRMLLDVDFDYATSA